MSKPLVILDPGHGGLGSFFYDMDNGVRLAHGWSRVRCLEGEEKHYFSTAESERWLRGERALEPRFYFLDKGRRVTWGDSGSLSPLNPRLCEKDLTLDVARTAHRVLARHLRVKATRDRDGYVAEDSRVALANRLVERSEGPAVLVSLHAEACHDPALGGCRVRIGGGASQSPARELARRLGEALALHLTEVGRERQAEQVIAEEPAEGVHRTDADPTPAPPAELALPAVSVNLGFLSNLDDARRLLDRHLRRELAVVLAEALVTHLGETGPREIADHRLPSPGRRESPGRPSPSSVMYGAV